jgi:hypothetical protein
MLNQTFIARKTVSRPESGIHLAGCSKQQRDPRGPRRRAGKEKPAEEEVFDFHDLLLKQSVVL